jgi:hypothetical protein
MRKKQAAFDRFALRGVFARFSRVSFCIFLHITHPVYKKAPG